MAPVQSTVATGTMASLRKTPWPISFLFLGIKSRKRLKLFFTGPGLTHEAEPHWQVGHGHGGSHVGAQVVRGRFDHRLAMTGTGGAVTATGGEHTADGEE